MRDPLALVPSSLLRATKLKKRFSMLPLHHMAIKRPCQDSNLVPFFCREVAPSGIRSYFLKMGDKVFEEMFHLANVIPSGIHPNLASPAGLEPA